MSRTRTVSKHLRSPTFLSSTNPRISPQQALAAIWDQIIRRFLHNPSMPRWCFPQTDGAQRVQSAVFLPLRRTGFAQGSIRAEVSPEACQHTRVGQTAKGTAWRGSLAVICDPIRHAIYRRAKHAKLVLFSVAWALHGVRDVKNAHQPYESALSPFCCPEPPQHK